MKFKKFYLFFEIFSRSSLPQSYADSYSARKPLLVYYQALYPLVFNSLSVLLTQVVLGIMPRNISKEEIWKTKLLEKFTRNNLTHTRLQSLEILSVILLKIPPDLLLIFWLNWWLSSPLFSHNSSVKLDG